MSVTATSLTPPVTLSRHTLVLLALVAVLFGLLAMHSVATNSVLATAEGHSHAAVGATGSGSVAVQLMSLEATVVPGLLSVCNDASPLDCLMVGVMCTMGMMALGITMLLYDRSSPSTLAVTLTRVSALISHYAAPFRPPSLSIFSISRT